MDSKLFKISGVIMEIDRNEDEMLIGHNPLLEDGQVIVEQDVKIDNNNNNSEEEEKNVVEIEFTKQKTNPENDENAIDFRWSDIRGKGEGDIAKAN